MKNLNIVCWIPCCLAGAASVLAQSEPYRSPGQFDPPPAVDKLTTATTDLAAPGSARERNSSPFTWRGLTLRPHLDVTVSYGDGVQPQPGVERKTWMEVISPGLLLELGPQWQLDYTPRLNFYSHDDFKDTVAHDASLHGGFTWNDWKFGIGQTYHISEDPLIETGTQTEQEIFTTILSATRPIGSKMLLELGANQSFRFTDVLNDSKSWSTMNWLNYQVAQRLSVAGGLGFGYDDVKLGSDMLNEQIQARVNSRIAEKLNLAIHGGVEIRQFADGDSDNLVNPIYGASIQYRPFEQTTVSLTGDRHVSPSLFDNQLTETMNISVAINQRLLEKFFLTLSGGYGTTDYLSSSSLDQNRTDDHLTFMARLSYNFLKRASASVFYQYTDNSSNIPGFDYHSSTVGLNLGYHF
jgi:hypothetical protein